MSSYVYMKVLESTPERYDRGIRLMSGGHIDALWAEVAERVATPETRVLDIGCGTGGLSLACAERGAVVTGLDKDAGMLGVARRKADAERYAHAPRWLELGVMEMEDVLEDESFDAIVSSLAMSELLPEERAYTLRQAKRLLTLGGVMILADEAAPVGRRARLAWRLRRAPRAALTWLLTQQTTHPMQGLTDEVRAAGFDELREERAHEGDFILVSARREERP
ncbi:MAG: class I SAM-dependent methyltransferase [Deltaproteobacteria bacterium]|nr:class I SAM-dependent methyltransferase [Deltaproteobacteria bacterium]